MRKRLLACFSTGICLLFATSVMAAEPVITDYTSHPIFTVNPVTPNIMIILDNSGSMNFNAYGTYPGDGGVVTDMPYAGEPYVPAVSTRVSSAWDDAEEYVASGITWNSSDLDISYLNNGADGGSTQQTYVGLRFQDIQIPPGAEITSAYLEFTAYSADVGTNQVTIEIYGEDTDNASTFAATNLNISGRTRTTNHANWDIPAWTVNNTYQSPDLTDVVQEIVDRDQWKSGNSMAFVLVNQTHNGNYRLAKAYDFSAATAPLLHIEYTQAENQSYYGYFNPEWFYTYGSNKFSLAYKKVSYDSANSRWNVTDTSGTASTLTDAQIVAGGLWDGNFMNWLCMRRIDVARKVMMGGLATARTGGGNQVNYGETPAQSSRRYIREFDSTVAVTPYDATTNKWYGVYNGYLYVDDDSNPFSGYTQRYKIAIQKDETFEPEDFVDGNLAGVLQTVGDEAYWGNTFFYTGTGNNRQGGYIASSIGTNMTSLVTDLQNTGCDTWTPLAETLYVTTQYFAQDDPESGLGYANGATGPFNNVNDPYYNNGEFVACAKSFVILLTDGASTMDSKIPAAMQDYDGDGDSTGCNESSGANCDYASGGTDYLDDVALYARTTDLRSDLDGDQNIILYPIYAFGNEANARDLLIDAAKNGGFEEKDGIFGPSADNEWDQDGDGLPDTYFEATDGNELKTQLLEAIYDILARAASGTAVSVLATSSEGEGNLVQAYFQPKLTTGLEETKWVGYLQSLWVDSLGYLREDSNGNLALDESVDKVVTFYTDDNGNTRVNKYAVAPDDEYPDIANDAPDETDKTLEDIFPVWEAGDVLASTNPDSRKIYTYTSGANWVEFNNDTVAKTDIIKPYLGVKDNGTWGYLGPTHDNRAHNLIHFIRGNDSGFTGTTTLRTRNVNGQVWRLGDIVHSTPVAIAPPPDNYGYIYADEPYQEYYNYHRSRSDRETMVYVGANDGMLHAFTSWQYNPGTKTFDNPDAASRPTESIGTEVWAYIPQALLPHLKWLPRLDYTHVYYVDMKPKIFDARIFDIDSDGDTDENDDDASGHINGWGTVLLSGLRMGGKSINVTDDFDYNSGTPDTTETFASSYFAIDITDPRNPEFLWERTYTDVGLTTNEPAIIKVNEKWMAIFGSGPSTYEGTSSDNGHVFIVDLATGTPYKSATGDDWIFETGESKAFMATAASLDKSLNFSVDAIYLGEAYEQGSSWKGAMYKVSVPWECVDASCDSINDYGDLDLGVYYDDPNGEAASAIEYDADFSAHGWKFSKLFDSPQPITAAPALSVDQIDNAWIYFGTGRYFSDADKSTADTQYMFGVKDPFFNSEHVSGGQFDPDESYRNYANATALTFDENDMFDADAYTIIYPWGCTEAPMGDCSAVPTGQVGDIYSDGSCECSYDSWYRCTEVTVGSCAAAGVDQANEEVWDDGDCVCKFLNPIWGCQETVAGSGACDGVGEGRVGDVNGDGSCTCFYWETSGSTDASCDAVAFGTVGTGLGDGTCEATKPAPTGWNCSERAAGSCPAAVTTGTVGDIYDDGGSCECGFFKCTEGIVGGCDDLDYTALPTVISLPDIQSDGSCMCTFVASSEALVVGTSGINSLSFDELIALAREYDGWKRTLAEPKERVLNKPGILGGLSLFTSYVPNDAVCSFGGNSYLYALYFETGTAFSEPVFDEGTVVIDGITVIVDRLDLGLGMSSSVGIHVGKQEGGKAKGFVQQSTGVIRDINLDPALNIRSGLTSWEEQ